MNKRISLSELSTVMEEALNKNGEVTFTVTGSSMLPLLRHRKDKVCIVKPREGSLKKYDIPLYIRRDGRYILHRITEVKADTYTVTGDNQWVKDYPVLHTQVIGVVKGIWRNGKYISCENCLYKAYCRVWVFIYPLRRLYLIAKHFCTGIISFYGYKTKGKP